MDIDISPKTGVSGWIAVVQSSCKERNENTPATGPVNRGTPGRKSNQLQSPLKSSSKNLNSLKGLGL